MFCHVIGSEKPLWGEFNKYCIVMKLGYLTIFYNKYYKYIFQVQALHTRNLIPVLIIISFIDLL